MHVYAHVHATHVAAGRNLEGVEQALNLIQVGRYYCIAIPSNNIDSLLKFATSGTHLTLFHTTAVYCSQ